jgi:hypothetical protein
MTNSLARAIGIACAIMAIHFMTPAMAAPLTLTPSAQSAPKAKAAPVAAKVQRERRGPNRMPTWNTYTMGNADLAFMSAAQYVDLSAYDGVIWMVAENEFSPLDFAAGTVRVVDPDELTEIDLANEPDLLLAQHQTTFDARPMVQASAAPARTDDSDEDDGVLNRILMTFAGALAMASALRMIIA